ncbi:MAG: valine--tRNA ligase [Planktomarina sp.]|nr:valine--tRNA ligase [Planktomarina sp.]|tara:strand:+ start:1615 stop:4542 length:2928 start_codon:yes stop_codon:yes gene_type:complete
MAMEKFNAAEAEGRLYKAWETAGCFTAGANSKPGASSYCIMIPPPNVTGVLHMGHAFNNTLQDILVRWHRMRGFDTLWQAGTDHAGIATQMVVERQLAETQQPGRVELGREKFLEKIWEWKEHSGGTIVNQLKRLGASCDWERTAFTMAGAQGDTRVGHENSPNFHDAVIKVFVEMYNKGLIYRGKRLVNWDPHFETAISDLEVENIEVAGHMWHFKYPLAGGATYTYIEKDEDGAITLEEQRDYISIATTRPETILGDGAVAVHPSDERYAPIIGMLCEIPVGPRAQRRLIPIITDEYPDKDFGSGAVKITGAHDFNDYQVAKRGGIPMYNLMDTKASMRADGLSYVEQAATAQRIANGEESFDVAKIAAMNLVPEEYRGMERFEARKRIVADITAEGLAVMETFTVTDAEGVETTEQRPKIENKPIMQPFGDRSKVVIEPMLTDQWFVDTTKIVEPALAAVRDGTVKVLPESEKKVYYHWLENIEPWCISRQLWWGHQIPVWFDDTGTQYCAATEAEAQKQAGPNAVLTRDPDVLDTWFSSGLWPIGTLGWTGDAEVDAKNDILQRFFPTADLITGSDILFFWVARMMMMQLAVVDKVPFNTIYLHGLVRDAKGKKMSKSTGNVVDPLEIIDEFGADALRFTNASMASLGGVLKLDMQRIAGYRNFGTKLWNACSFAEYNEAFQHRSDATPVPALALNKWIIGEVGRVRVAVDAALDGYRFNDAASALYAFVWGSVCDRYLELSKPILKGDHSSGDAGRLETQTTLAWVLEQSMTQLHPIMPFITEELWSITAPRDKMLVHQDWPSYGHELVDEAAAAEISWAIALIDAIRSARAQMNVPAGAKVPLVQVQNDAAGSAALAANMAQIQQMARITEVTIAVEMPKGAITVSAPHATFGLPLADIIDVAAEKARLEKNMGKLAKELGGLRGRLGNPKFAASAPPEVLAETQANLAAREEEEQKLSEALARLAEIV